MIMRTFAAFGSLFSRGPERCRRRTVLRAARGLRRGTRFSATRARQGVARGLRRPGCVALLSFLGTVAQGSMGASECKRGRAQFPTVEGALCSAVERAALDHAAVAGAGANSVENCACEVHSRASRTDKGVHAFANAVHLKVTVMYAEGKSSSRPEPNQASSALENWCAAVNRESAPLGIHALRCFDVPNHSLHMRHECVKREYRYYVPYRALYLPGEQARAQLNAVSQGLDLFSPRRVRRRVASALGAGAAG